VGLFSFGVLFRSSAGLTLSLGLWPSVLIALPIALQAALIVNPIFRRVMTGEPDSLGAKVRMTERVFEVLQLGTAGDLAFAHGSNDVANAIGPLSATFHALSDGIRETVSVSSPILMVGAVGILLSLACYGYKVMATIGHGITQLSPSAGFSAVFTAATVILLGTKLGLPVSASHIKVGAVIGVGLAWGAAAINQAMLRTILVNWVITIPLTAGLAAAFTWVAGRLI